MTPRPPERRETLMGKLVNVGILILAAGSLAFAASLVVPMNPVPDLALRVLEPVQAGRPVVVEVSYRKTLNVIPAEVHWQLVDGVVITISNTVTILPQGAHTKLVMLPAVPQMTPSVYRLQVTAIYHVLPWRDEIVQASSQEFRVHAAQPEVDR